MKHPLTALSCFVCLLFLCKSGSGAFAQEIAAAQVEVERVDAGGDGDDAGDDAVVDDSEEQERQELEAAKARPLSADPVQIYGWREWVVISDGSTDLRLKAKLDTGAYTSSIHAEEAKLFERDGKKWVRFVTYDVREKEDPERMRIEAPLVRIAQVKEPAGDSDPREVVMLTFEIGDRTVKTEFTLNDRHNMLTPILIGRRTIRKLGWVDPDRAYLADKKVMR